MDPVASLTSETSIALFNRGQITDEVIQRVGATVAGIVIGSLQRKRQKKRCYLQAYQDIQQATALINEWQDSINRLKTQIDGLNASIDPKSEEQDDVPVSLHIIALELECGELEVKIRERRRYIDSFRIVPMELFAEILQLAVEEGTPRVFLAMVCRCWKEMVLSIPRIWSRISILVPPYVTKPREFLRRRIHLAKAVPLDITLSATCDGRPIDTVKKLHHLILATNTSRWKSLTILDGTRLDHDMAEWTKGLTIKRFTQLQSLDIQYRYNPAEDIYCPLYDRIANTAARLSTCLLTMHQAPVGAFAPGIIQKFFTNLTTLQVGWEFMWHISLPPALNELRLTAIPENPFTVTSIIFPRIVSLPRISVVAIPNLKMDQVTHLTIDSLWTGTITLQSNFVVYLPALEELTLLQHGFPGLQYLIAPRMKTLSIGVASRGSHQRWGLGDSETKEMISLFSSDPPSFHITPTTLRLHSAFKPDVACLILERWPQLRHASFHVTAIFPRPLETTLRKRDAIEGDKEAVADWKACPVLETLDLETARELDQYYDAQWREFAETILVSRRIAALHRVSWGCSYKRSSLTRESVCK